MQKQTEHDFFKEIANVANLLARSTPETLLSCKTPNEKIEKAKSAPLALVSSHFSSLSDDMLSLLLHDDPLVLAFDALSVEDRQRAFKEVRSWYSDYRSANPLSLVSSGELAPPSIHQSKQPTSPEQSTASTAIAPDQERLIEIAERLIHEFAQEVKKASKGLNFNIEEDFDANMGEPIRCALRIEQGYHNDFDNFEASWSLAISASEITFLQNSVNFLVTVSRKMTIYEIEHADPDDDGWNQEILLSLSNISSVSEIHNAMIQIKALPELNKVREFLRMQQRRAQRAATKSTAD